MSDSDEFEYESDDDPYGGAEEEDGDEEAIQIENTFYEADDNKQNYPEQALEQFQRVVTLEAARGTEVVWRFKALQNIVILCARIGRFDEMANRYRELLSYMDQVGPSPSHGLNLFKPLLHPGWMILFHINQRCPGEPWLLV